MKLKFEHGVDRLSAYRDGIYYVIKIFSNNKCIAMFMTDDKSDAEHDFNFFKAQLLNV